MHFKHNENNKFSCEYIIDNEKYDEKERYRFAEININDYENNHENKNDLEELVNNGHSIDDIAYMFATSQPYIAKLFNKYGIKSHRL